MKFDLHCHSTASDGKLSPQQVLSAAAETGLQLFALTDHDTLKGYHQLADVEKPFCFVPGVELSSVWSGVSVHIVGLDFDPQHPAILTVIDRLRQAREQRARLLDKKLAAQGMPGSLQGALQYCPDIGQVGRPHFAEFLCAQGYVTSTDQAFDRWLGSGKMGDIKTEWPEMAVCVRSITEAGGVAVLAHPLRYKMTFSKLRRLIDAFRQAGGQAVEISGSQMQPEQKKQLQRYVQQSGLAGSGGSDFHSPDWRWAQIGKIEPIPAEIQPVWELFTRTRVVAV